MYCIHDVVMPELLHQVPKPTEIGRKLLECIVLGIEGLRRYHIM